MKKIFLITVAVVMMMALCIGCTDKPEETPAPTEAATPEATAEPTAEPTVEPTAEPTAKPALSAENPIRIATLAGPTGMGMIEMLNDDSGVFDMAIYTAPDQLLPKIIQGEVDIAAVPSNLAAVLNNKTKGKLAVLSVNTLGVLYIVENGDTVNTVADLKGKTIHATGQGASPEYVLNEVLVKNDLVVGEDVTVQYMQQHADLANQVAAGDIKLAVLPEPFVTTVLAKNENVKVKIALDDAWQEIYGEGKSMPMSATVVQKEYLEANPEAVKAFMEAYKASVDFANTESKEAAALMVEHKIIGSAALAEKAIPRCQITYVDGQEAKDLLTQYFQVLFDSNPKSVGGALPDDSLYYIP